jgi:hypothetical protein
LLLPHQGQGQPGPGIAGELLAELLIELGCLRQVPLALHQVGQQQADRQGLGLDGGALGLVQQALELAAGFPASALLELEQGHPLQGFDLARILVKDLAQFPFGSAAVMGGAAQVGQQQPQGPAAGFLVGHLLQQDDRFGLATEAQQQAEQALAI